MIVRPFCVLTVCLSIGPGGFPWEESLNWMAMLFAIGGVGIVLAAQFEFPQSKETAGQVVREGSFELDASAQTALVLFTPEGERFWVKGWDPKPVYPPREGVVFKANSVFRVDQGGEHSLWTIVEADLQAHVAEYIYVVEGERLSRVRVQVEPLAAQRSSRPDRIAHK
jgi:hypothetical protein